MAECNEIIMSNIKLMMNIQAAMQLLMERLYHIAGNFDGETFDIFDAFQQDHQNFSCQILR